MNHKNDFKAFSINNNANVVSQERYEESQSLKTGFPPDNITVHLLNKVLRQSSTIASVVSNFIATYSGNDVLDDGDIIKLAAQLNEALEQKIATKVPNASLAQKGITQLTEVIGNSNTLAATQKLVSDVNNNANSRLSKNQNGADIPDKNVFVKNLGLSETVELAGKAVPSSRKINGKALTGDVSLSAGDVGAVSTQRLAEISNNGKFQDCLSTGFYRVGVFDSNTVSDFPRDSVNTVLYSYGILEVQTSSETISQRYTSHIGQIAIRQSWDSGKTWHGWYVAYDNNSRDVVTAGIPLPYPHRYAPVGYLACNGQTFDKSRYPKLALAYPDGRIPDLRGEFIRGWDDSRGIDPGRVCGTWQGDAIRNITGSFPGAIASNFHLAAQGAFYGELNLGIATDGTPKSANINPDNAYGFGFDASRVVPTANETRPRNVAFNYIVRAA